MTALNRGAIFHRGSTGAIWQRPAPKAVLYSPKPSKQTRRARIVQVSASSGRGGSGFTAGFIVGGVIFGSLGFLFAPQISRALLTEDQKLKLPRFLEDDVRDPEQTKQELSDKIAQLNAAIDEVSNQMKAKDPKPETVIAEEVIA